jgi:uncharacterized protein YndB with AHSA1/START domain
MTDSTILSSGVIERQLWIAARPETIFALWIEPDRIVQWMGRTATIEARPGGLFRLDYNGSDIVRGEVLEIDPPRRLVISWGWEADGDPTPPGSSRVEMTLIPDGDGTRLHLRHSGLPGAAVTGHAEGWDQFLPALATVAEANPNA